MINPSAIILAAGLSSRMGRLKGLLPWRGTTLIQYQIEQMLAAGVKDIHVVLGYKADKMIKKISPYEVNIILNEQYEQGKSSSIRKGASAIQNFSNGIFITGVDQPVPAKTLIILLKHLRETNAPVIIPTYKEKRGHPLLLAGRLHHDLLQVNEATKGLRGIIDTYKDKIAHLPVNDPSVLFNFNRLEDYEKNRVCKEANNENIRN